MINNRVVGLNHIYFDKNLNNFSNTALGIFLRSIGHGLRVCYINTNPNSKIFNSFFENLCLDKIFVKNLNSRFYAEICQFNKKGLINRSILPFVEFTTTDKAMFIQNIRNFDVVIFDDVDLEIISKDDIENIFALKNQLSEVIFTFSNEKEFQKAKKLFNIISIYDYKKQANLFSNKKVITLTGSGRGKSLYSFGELIREFINKKQVKLIYFDKDEYYYGEMTFFKALKNWAKFNKMYGEFDFVITGSRRHQGLEYRAQNTTKDLDEAREGFELLKTAIKKQTPVIADELITAMNKNLLDEKEVLDVLDTIENQLYITGNNPSKTILDKSSQIIEIVDETEIKDLGYKLGVDF